MIIGIGISIEQKELFEKHSFEHGFGTNEFIEYSSLKEFMSCFTVTDIPREHSEIIEKYIGKSFGTWIPELYDDDL